MIKRSSKTTKLDAPPAKVRTDDEIADALGLSLLEYRLFLQVFGTISRHADAGREGDLKVVATTAALLKGITPKDDIERMLAAQMVATHENAMECLRRATLGEQTFAGRDLNLKYASKLMAIYTHQMDALNKHRGKGQQKVTVEHVHIESGAQAVVGNIRTGDRSAQPQSTPANAPKAIAKSSDKTLDLEAKAPVGRRHKLSR